MELFGLLFLTCMVHFLTFFGLSNVLLSDGNRNLGLVQTGLGVLLFFVVLFVTLSL